MSSDGTWHGEEAVDVGDLPGTDPCDFGSSEAAASVDARVDPRTRYQAVAHSYGCNRQSLRRLAGRLCRAGFDPDDLMQEALLKTMLYSGRLPPGVNYAAWMRRVLRNLLVDWTRRRAASPVTASVDAERISLAEQPCQEQAWWEDLSSSQLEAAVQQLPDDLRIPFERFVFQRQSQKQIAASLGIALSTVGTRMLRARRQLRGLLHQAALPQDLDVDPCQP
jgi:RNA polymerase sigma-70 factor, ECF subfamily